MDQKSTTDSAENFLQLLSVHALRDALCVDASLRKSAPGIRSGCAQKTRTLCCDPHNPISKLGCISPRSPVPFARQRRPTMRAYAILRTKKVIELRSVY